MIAMLMPREEITKAVNHQIEITLKTPSWLTNEAESNETNGYESSDTRALPYTPELIIEEADDSCDTD